MVNNKINLSNGLPYSLMFYSMNWELGVDYLQVFLIFVVMLLVQGEC